VYRHALTITDDDTTVLHFGGDPTAPGFGQHLTFDQILKRCGSAWSAFLDSLSVFGTGVIVPRLEVDYQAEVLSGDLTIDVGVVSVGRTSFRLRLACSQAGRPVATVHVVIVSFGYDDRGPLALTAEQRALLHPHLLAE
jgi:acyl-CoA thioesterase FadM